MKDCLFERIETEFITLDLQNGPSFLPDDLFISIISEKLGFDIKDLDESTIQELSQNLRQFFILGIKELRAIYKYYVEKEVNLLSIVNPDFRLKSLTLSPLIRAFPPINIETRLILKEFDIFQLTKLAPYNGGSIEQFWIDLQLLYKSFRTVKFFWVDEPFL